MLASENISSYIDYLRQISKVGQEVEGAVLKKKRQAFKHWLA